jgi:predicted amidohydrolase YtcJ
MKTSPLSLTSPLLAVILLGSCQSGREPASLVIQGARIITFDNEQAEAEAVAISGERIVAVGSRDEIQDLVGPSTEVIELTEGLVLPGFNDSHIHLLSGGLTLFEVDLFDALSLVEIQERIRTFAEENPDDEWIIGAGWRYTAMPDGRLPTRQDLDAVVPVRPAYMRAYDGHAGWTNTKALEIAGVTRDSKAEGYGEVVKDPETGEPTGALKEGGATGLVRRHLPAPDREKKLEALRRATALLNSLGTVSIQNASGNEEELGLYRELQERGELTMRVHMMMFVNKDTTDEEIARFAELAREHAGPWLGVTGVKMVVDGVIESHTAIMLEPYSDRPSSSGSSPYTQEELDDLVARCHAAGLQVWIHAIGDGGVRMALDAFERAKAAGGPEDARFRIEHIEVIAPEDIPRFKEIGVIASMQPIHSDPDTVAVWSRAVGPERVDYAFPWQSFVDAGAPLAFGTDWPAAISNAPLRGLHNAVNRQTPEGKPEGGWIPAQRVSVETGLDAFTASAAWASFEEGRRGTLSPGKLADLVVVSKDLFEIPPEEIHTVRALMTVVGGKVVYRR